ncbi:antiterminator, partial [Salmonella enterica subsp. enterica serovar Typhimurium]|nr:antiterminator [Salmonella enterica subsp. enterica serovar Typhimurium]EBV0157194.1 antiterminator [Salmonella enterica subsp. enterica serovar Typhimurium]
LKMAEFMLYLPMREAFATDAHKIAR